MLNLTEQWENGTLGRDERFVQKSGRTRKCRKNDMTKLVSFDEIMASLPKDKQQKIHKMTEELILEAGLSNLDERLSVSNEKSKEALALLLTVAPKMIKNERFHFKEQEMHGCKK